MGKSAGKETANPEINWTELETKERLVSGDGRPLAGKDLSPDQVLGLLGEALDFEGLTRGEWDQIEKGLMTTSIGQAKAVNRLRRVLDESEAASQARK